MKTKDEPRKEKEYGQNKFTKSKIKKLVKLIKLGNEYRDKALELPIISKFGTGYVITLNNKIGTDYTADEAIEWLYAYFLNEVEQRDKEYKAELEKAIDKAWKLAGFLQRIRSRH